MMMTTNAKNGHPQEDGEHEVEDGGDGAAFACQFCEHVFVAELQMQVTKQLEKEIVFLEKF
jgi:hypothetical protein